MDWNLTVISPIAINLKLLESISKVSWDDRETINSFNFIETAKGTQLHNISVDRTINTDFSTNTLLQDFVIVHRVYMTIIIKPCKDNTGTKTLKLT